MSGRLSIWEIPLSKSSKTWMTERHGDLTMTLEWAYLQKWLWLPEMWKEKADPRIGIFATYPNPRTPLLKHWVISNAHSKWSLNQKTVYPLNLPKIYDTCLEVKIPEHPIWATMLDSTMHWYLSVMSMAYGLKYASKKTNLNAFDWLETNSDSRTTYFWGLTSFFSNKVGNQLDHHLMLKDHLNQKPKIHLWKL